MIDPPWRIQKGGSRKVRPNQGKDLDYDTLSINEIPEIIDSILFEAEERHVVFLWTIDKTLCSGEKIFENRGYKRHARFIWDKGNGVAPAFTVRYSHEYLTWFYRGGLLPIAKDQRGKFTTVLREVAREHSRKPDCAYDMVSALYPSANKIDVFSREKRTGWDQWGDQVGYFKELT